MINRLDDLIFYNNKISTRSYFNNDNNEINLTNDDNSKSGLDYSPDKNLILCKSWGSAYGTDSALRLLDLNSQNITKVTVDNASDYTIYRAKISVDAKFICSVF